MSMTVSRLFCVVGVCLLPTLPAVAQQAPVRTTTTAVNRTTLYRLLPGQGAAYAQDVFEHGMPVLEEQKKAGIITGYQFFSKATTESPDDWNVGVTVTYANYAALDNLGAKLDPITLKHYGTAEKRTAAAAARNQIRTLVRSTLTTTVSYNR
jgi:hypothetical protein